MHEIVKDGSPGNDNYELQIHRDLNKSWGWFIKQLKRFLQQVTMYFIITLTSSKNNMNIASSISTTVFEMNTGKHSKGNLLHLLPFLGSRKRKKKKKRYYGKNQSEGLSELFFELKLNAAPSVQEKETTKHS